VQLEHNRGGGDSGPQQLRREGVSRTSNSLTAARYLEGELFAANIPLSRADAGSRLLAPWRHITSDAILRDQPSLVTLKLMMEMIVFCEKEVIKL
jgi:hypothetical protein